MVINRLVLLGILFFCGHGSLDAQFFPAPAVPGVPVLVPNGIGFHYRGDRLRVAGFFNTGYSVGVIPAYPTGPVFPGGVLPVVPVQTLPLVGYSDTRVTYQVIAPTVILGPGRGLRGSDELDLSGVDLDSAPSPLHVFERDRRGPPRVAIRPRIELDRPVIDPLPPKGEKPLPMPKEEKPKAEMLKPAEPPPSFLEQGVRSFREGEFGLAALSFRQAALSDPARARPHFLLAHAYVAQGKLRDAVSALEEGLKKEPDFPRHAFDPRKELYKGMDEEYQRQRKMLDALIAEHPKQAAYLFLHGYLDWFEGSRDEARRTFGRVRPLAAEPWFVDRFLGS